jgi:hypothetical protein
MDDDHKHLLFVGGAPRSGTTLLQNMLDCHPEITGAPEFKHVVDVMGLRKKMHSSIWFGQLDDWCSYDEVDEAILAFLESFLSRMREKCTTRYLSEKTPTNVLVFTQLLKLFPSCLCIHVVRDPRAVVSSLLEVGKRARAQGKAAPAFIKGFPEAVHYTKKCLDKGIYAEKREPQRVLRVTYEDLVTRTKEETRRVCDFLDLEWHPAMLRPSSKKHPNERAMTCERNSIWYDTASFNRDPEAQSLQKWATLLTAEEQEEIVRAFAEHREFIAF